MQAQDHRADRRFSRYGVRGLARSREGIRLRDGVFLAAQNVFEILSAEVRVGPGGKIIFTQCGATSQS